MSNPNAQARLEEQLRELAEHAAGCLHYHPEYFCGCGEMDRLRTATQLGRAQGLEEAAFANESDARGLEGRICRIESHDVDPAFDRTQLLAEYRYAAKRLRGCADAIRALRSGGGEQR